MFKSIQNACFFNGHLLYQLLKFCDKDALKDFKTLCVVSITPEETNIRLSIALHLSAIMDKI